MEELHTRIASHDDSVLRPQKLDVLPRGKEIEPKTNPLVTLPIRIRHQISPYSRKQSCAIGRIISKTWFHSHHWQWQRRPSHAPWQLISKSNRFGSSKKNYGMQRVRLRRHRSVKNSAGKWFKHNQKRTRRLVLGKGERRESSLLQGKELHPARHNPTKGHCWNVPWSRNGRSPRRIRNI